MTKPTDVKLMVRKDSNSLIHWGLVVSVDSEKNTMSVKLVTENRTVNNLQINQAITFGNSYMKIIPVPNFTYALLYRGDIDDTGFVHLGYFLPKAEKVVDDIQGTKKGDIIYQRYLRPGEINFVSISGSEIYMPDNGDIFVKTNKNSFAKFNNLANNLELNVPDVISHNYKIDVKTGRMYRYSSDNVPAIVRDVTTEEAFIEHTIDVGIIYNSDNLPVNFEVGRMSLSDRVHSISGQAEKAFTGGLTYLNFLLDMFAGVKISIDETGDFFIVNKNNNSRFVLQTGMGSNGDATEIQFKTSDTEFRVGKDVFSFIMKGLGDFVKFGSKEDGTTSFCLKIGDNTIIIDNNYGLQVTQATGAGVKYGKEGEVTINSGDGSYISVTEDGIYIQNNGKPIALGGSTTQILSTNGLVIGNSTLANNGVLDAYQTALMFDSHMHTGPAGPPIIKWSTPPSMLETLKAKGIKTVLGV